jgi:hypothetical protein
MRPTERGRRPVRINVVGFPHLSGCSTAGFALRYCGAMRALAFAMAGRSWVGQRLKLPAAREIEWNTGA